MPPVDAGEEGSCEGTPSDKPDAPDEPTNDAPAAPAENDGEDKQ